MKSATIVLFAVVGFVALLSLATAAPEPENAAPAAAPAVKPKKNKYSWITAEDKKKLSKLSKKERSKFIAEKRAAHLATLSGAAKVAFLAEEEQALAPLKKFRRWLKADKKNDMTKMTKEEKKAFLDKKMEEYKATLIAADKAALEAKVVARKVALESGKGKQKVKRPEKKLLNKE